MTKIVIGFSIPGKGTVAEEIEFDPDAIPPGLDQKFVKAWALAMYVKALSQPQEEEE